MDLYEMADQIVKLLRNRGRLTYRVLKLQFRLDDETLEALKEEILYSQLHVVDDEGKGLIWTGVAETKPEPESPTQLVQPTAQAEPATHAETLPRRTKTMPSVPCEQD